MGWGVPEPWRGAEGEGRPCAWLRSAALTASDARHKVARLTRCRGATVQRHPTKMNRHDFGTPTLVGEGDHHLRQARKSSRSSG